jgi:hypothetical protein
VQVTEEDLIGLLDQISAEETKKKETKIVVSESVLNEAKDFSIVVEGILAMTMTTWISEVAEHGFAWS